MTLRFCFWNQNKSSVDTMTPFLWHRLILKHLLSRQPPSMTTTFTCRSPSLSSRLCHHPCSQLIFPPMSPDLSSLALAIGEHLAQSLYNYPSPSSVASKQICPSAVLASLSLRTTTNKKLLGLVNFSWCSKFGQIADYELRNGFNYARDELHFSGRGLQLCK